MPSSSCLALFSSSSSVAFCRGSTTLHTSSASLAACCCPSPSCPTSPLAPSTSTASESSSSCHYWCIWGCSLHSSSGSTSTPSTGNGRSISHASPSPASSVSAMITTLLVINALKFCSLSRGHVVCCLEQELPCRSWRLRYWVGGALAILLFLLQDNVVLKAITKLTSRRDCGTEVLGHYQVCYSDIHWAGLLL